MNDQPDKTNDVIQAAGGLVWREAAHGPEVLLVHRPHYDDWSFPKGKMEPGETWTETAMREVEEETGMKVALSDFAGSLSYLVKQRVKIVLFWNMQIRAETALMPDDEVDQVKWLPVEQALTTLDYHGEQDILRAVVASRQDLAR